MGTTKGAVSLLCRALTGQGLQGTITTEGWMQLEGLQGFSFANNLLTGSLSKDWLLPDTVRGMPVLHAANLAFRQVWADPRASLHLH